MTSLIPLHRRGHRRGQVSCGNTVLCELSTYAIAWWVKGYGPAQYRSRDWWSGQVCADDRGKRCISPAMDRALRATAKGE